MARPDERLHRLRILEEEERQKLLVSVNETRQELVEATVVDLFEAQAARTPGAAAVMCGEVTLSYAELNRRANQLAHYLISLGVEAETRIGIAIERSRSLNTTIHAAPAAILDPRLAATGQDHILT